MHINVDKTNTMDNFFKSIQDNYSSICISGTVGWIICNLAANNDCSRDIRHDTTHTCIAAGAYSDL